MSSRELALRIAQICDDKRGEAIKILHVEEAIAGVTDYFVLVTGRSDRQLKSLTEAIRVALKEQGEIPLGIEGYEEATWILMDFGDVVVHLFQAETRAYYNLEFLWSAAPVVPFEQKPRPEGPQPGLDDEDYDDDDTDEIAAIRASDRWADDEDEDDEEL